jgi:hypothetical protein
MDINAMITSDSIITANVVCFVCGHDQPQASYKEHVKKHSVEDRFAGIGILFL